MAKKKQKLDVIDGSKEEHKAFAGKNFSPHHLVSMKPKTRPQEQFMQSFYEGVPIISQVGSSGCVDSETEFMSQDGWKKISEYSDGDKVMQVSQMGLEATLVDPLNYIKEPCDWFYSIKTKRGIDQWLSPDHDVAYTVKSKTRLNKKNIEDVLELNEVNNHGFIGKVPTTYDYSDGYSLGLSENEIRLGVALKADGHINNINSMQYIIRLKKERKIERMEWLLNELEYDYKKRYQESTGYTIFSLYAGWCSKTIADWMMCSKEDAQVIMDEYHHWDGLYQPFGNRISEYSTADKEEADAMQYFGNICGFRSSINTHDRVGETLKEHYQRKSVEYTVTFSNQTNISLMPYNNGKTGKTMATKEPSVDGYKYCFTVPTGFLLLRRNDSVFVTGNCGKTYMALYCALSEVLDRSTVYEKVIIVRSAVQSREIGFLSGDSSEKAAAYSLPYISLCDELLTFKSNNFENLQAKGLIQFELTSFLRGLTFDNAIIIVDEVQNMNYSELSTITTRTGVNSKLLLCGDTKQNDLYRKKNDVSGLEDYLRVLDHMPSHSYDCVMYHPEDIVRSGIVKEFLLAEEEVF